MTEPAARDTLSNTRRRIILTLKQHGEATAVDLAGSLFVTVSAIRQHLGRLTGEGLITYREVGSGPGRRRRLYTLTPAADRLFPGGYEALLEDLIGFLEKQDPDLLEKFVGGLRDRRAEIPARAAAQGRRAGIEALVTLFEREDYLPEIQEDNGAELLRLFHCPIVNIARAFPRLCECEAELIAAATRDGAPERVRWRLNGDATCAYRLPGMKLSGNGASATS